MAVARRAHPRRGCSLRELPAPLIMPSPLDTLELLQLILKELVSSEGGVEALQKVLATCQTWLTVGEPMIWHHLNGLGRVGLLLPARFIDHDALRVRIFNFIPVLLTDVRQSRRIRAPLVYAMRWHPTPCAGLR